MAKSLTELGVWAMARVAGEEPYETDETHEPFPLRAVPAELPYMRRRHRGRTSVHPAHLGGSKPGNSLECTDPHPPAPRPLGHQPTPAPAATATASTSGPVAPVTTTSTHDPTRSDPATATTPSTSARLAPRSGGVR